jgi:uncharacterized damage-inducible protein DinB
LLDSFDRVRGAVHQALRGLTPAQLSYRVDDTANSIAWLIWHLTRVQDDHVADATGQRQVWISQGWNERFGLALDDADTGYGHGSDEVAAVRVDSAQLLGGYYDAVHNATRQYLAQLTDDDLARIVDDAWDPPVSLGVRLVSVATDDLQHAGQAAFVRGIGERSRWRP